MLVKDLSLESLPQVKISDKVGDVLNLMYQYQTESLPVVEDGKFAGIIKEELLLNSDDNLELSNLPLTMKEAFVNEHDHVLKAIMIATTSQFSHVPVLNSDGNLVGELDEGTLLLAISSFMDLNEPGAIIVLETDAVQYSFSEISRLVEGNDAQITQLNSSANKETGKMTVTIKVNRQEVSDLVATFQRHEYDVRYYFGEEQYTNELKNNYDNLIHYLNI
ncbi:MAG: CBS domain-containing protein [Niabella sp.]|nr:MAG: CBS domain-containing protein [Niabella sp.]